MAYDWFLIAQEHGHPTPKQYLEHLYIDLGQTMQEIADEVGCSTWVVRYALDRWEIPKRPHGGARHQRREISSSVVGAVIKKLEKEKA